MTSEVRAPAGVVRGVWDADVAVFRGIPFAEPPVGELRFAAPRPVRRWDGVRDALSYGPPPPQAGVFGMDALVRDSDDWLTINVWTPELSAGAGLPVMVWIQGGAFVFGMSSLPEYDGARLARDGVVLVTFNYRVGAEGFAWIEGAPHNRGLLDQVAALEWVRDNIEAFGGDPGRVTIFGQSAGGGSVASLLAMPRAAGLFRRAIAQSVTSVFFTPELARQIGTTLAADADPATLGPDELSGAGDAFMARTGEWADRWGRPAHRQIPFAPVVDGDVLPATPWQALADGAGKGVELIAGHTRDEHRLFSLIQGTLGQVTQEQAQAALQIYAPDPRRYLESFPGASPEELHDLVHADWLFRMSSSRLAEAQVAGGGRAYVFELTWPAPGMGGVLGACHGLDVPLVFGNLDKGQPAMLLGDGPTGEAEALSARMRTAWTAFATHGDPGWPAYGTAHRLTQVFDVEPAVTAYPAEKSRLIWADHPFAALAPVAG
ncbi:carboxylesterase/lipase family protein [Kibdelosporangium phytohabitans]|uniref:Carboxylic ester hydrolase n=1 Tax=Kibdelosporangium phytohabitans TaxID=860235 RepID=A0A0N9HMQ4_9PSEU|nr:carboxylesterase family protein [Kibdelosporangium phytohabitans]ALG08108.1 carboxylesterase [Kibdelosporangium phytohabitans]MBE1470916.1 para-nitrobenzyl esterase [Kibdelosporangium phytohabitans]